MVRSLGSRLLSLAVGLGLVMTGSLSAELSQQMFDGKGASERASVICGGKVMREP